MKTRLPSFSRLGLQYKFILITTCAIIAVMSLVGYLAVERETKILYAEVEKQGRLLGETLAIPIINDLIYERLGLVEEGGLLDNYILEIFSRQDADLLYITILDEGGRVISHNNITEYGKVYADPLTKKALKADRGFAEAYANIGRIKWPSNKEAAFALFEKAFMLAPVLSDVAKHYYNAVVSLSRFKRAKAIFREAAALYPLNKRLRLFLKEAPIESE